MTDQNRLRLVGEVILANKVGQQGLGRCPRCVENHSPSHRSAVRGRTDHVSSHFPGGENKQGHGAAGLYNNHSNAEGERDELVSQQQFRAHCGAVEALF